MTDPANYSKLIDLDRLNAFKTQNDAKYADAGDIPTKVSDLDNDLGFITGGGVASVSAVGPISAATEDGAVTITHDTSGTSAGTSGSDTDQTPAFGGTFSVPFFTTNNTGHITARGTRNVTVPSTAASTDGAGLMTAAMFDKLDGIEAGAQAHVAPTQQEVVNALGYTPPTQDTTYPTATTSRDGIMTSDMVTKLNGVAAGAEVNQNAFSIISVDGTPMAADSKSDTLMLTAGANVTLTPDAENDRVTIAATDTTYAAATTAQDGLMAAGDKSKLEGIAAGAQVNQNAFSNIVAGGNTVAADGETDTVTLTAGDNVTISSDTETDVITISASDTTYTLATALANGLMSSGHYSKLEGIEAGAQAHVAPTESEVLSALGYTPADSSALSGYLATSLKGVASGLAELDANGTVPSAQLPSFVDDVLEFSSESSFPAEGETGKIYVDTSTNKTYRWSGTQYTAIGSDLALGTTSSTAFRGDLGNTAYNHAADASRLPTAQASGLYKLAVTEEGHVASVAAVQKADITALGVPAQDTTYTAGTGLSLTGTEFTLADGVVAAGTAGSTTAQAPGFGGTADIPYVTADTYGRVTGKGTATLTIPNTAASASASGLMTATMFTKLEGISDSADAVSFSQGLASGTQIGSITINGVTTAIYAPAAVDTSTFATKSYVDEMIGEIVNGSY